MSPSPPLDARKDSKEVRQDSKEVRKPSTEAIGLPVLDPAGGGPRRPSMPAMLINLLENPTYIIPSHRNRPTQETDNLELPGRRRSCPMVRQSGLAGPAVPALPAIGSTQASPRINSRRPSRNASDEEAPATLKAVHHAVSEPYIETAYRSSGLPARRAKGRRGSHTVRNSNSPSFERRTSEQSFGRKTSDQTHRKSSFAEKISSFRRKSSDERRKSSKDSQSIQKPSGAPSGSARRHSKSFKQEQQGETVEYMPLCTKGILPFPNPKNRNPENEVSESHFQALWEKHGTKDTNDTIDLDLSDGFSDVSDVE